MYFSNVHFIGITNSWLKLFDFFLKRKKNVYAAKNRLFDTSQTYFNSAQILKFFKIL